MIDFIKIKITDETLINKVWNNNILVYEGKSEKRFDDEIIELLLRLKWWDLPLSNIKNICEKLCSKPDKDLLLDLISSHRSQDF